MQRLLIMIHNWNILIYYCLGLLFRSLLFKNVNVHIEIKCSIFLFFLFVSSYSVFITWVNSLSLFFVAKNTCHIVCNCRRLLTISRILSWYLVTSTVNDSLLFILLLKYFIWFLLYMVHTNLRFRLPQLYSFPTWFGSRGKQIFFSWVFLLFFTFFVKTFL